MDVIFAHRPDYSSELYVRRCRFRSLIHFLAPMEEIVRAFNYVIEKGWVSIYVISRMSWAKLNCSRLLCYFRPSTGRPRGSIPCVQSMSRNDEPLSNDRFCIVDVADKLNLIAPIAEQCQHQYVLGVCEGRDQTLRTAIACSTASVPSESTLPCTKNTQSALPCGRRWPAVCSPARYVNGIFLF